jgi:hypothetical protein
MARIYPFSLRFVDPSNAAITWPQSLNVLEENHLAAAQVNSYVMH